MKEIQWNLQNLWENILSYSLKYIAYGYNDELIILRLPIYLIGVARAAYNRIDEDDKKNWITMENIIGKHLMTGDVSRMFRQQLRRCKQRKPE